VIFGLTRSFVKSRIVMQNNLLKPLRWEFTKLVLTGVVAFMALAQAPVAAKQTPPADKAATVAMSELPPQGVQTYERILQGGPFPYDKDGTVFGNRERILPAQKRGYYREYTVKTPGSRDRGARRIVCGGQPKAPDACFYTADHYSSFRKIVP
jgi:ribonuclease T1